MPTRSPTRLTPNISAGRPSQVCSGENTRTVAVHQETPLTSDYEHECEPLLTLQAAAEKLGLPAFKVVRAAGRGIFPTYRLLNSRKLVRISEVVAAIERSREGGQS